MHSQQHMAAEQFDSFVKRRVNIMRKLLFLSVCMVLLLGSNALAVPETFNESPTFAEMVAAGELPPVEERLPKDVYVVEPYEEIGRYGGIVRSTTTNAMHAGGDFLLSIFPAPVKPNADLSDIVPNVVKDVVPSEDTTVWTFHLREGLRWSDGEPFTSEDIMFWYEDVLFNEDLTPTIGSPWRDGATGEIVEVIAIDDYTVEFHFPAAKPFLLNDLIHVTGTNMFVPKHFLSQFHPSYADPDELRSMAEAAGFAEWYELFGYWNDNTWGNSHRVGRPVLTPWVLDTFTTDRRTWKPNPYFWQVDTEGNQLPYLEGIHTEIVSDIEVVTGMIMSGTVDIEGRNTSLANYPLYRGYEEEGNYRTVLWDTTFGNAVFFMFNMTHNDPVMREIFQDVRFRQAMSLALDRDEINDVEYFGQGTPRQFTLLESSVYYEPEFATAFADYDPTQAAALLDEMGLDAKDSDGMRLRPDGERLIIIMEYPEVVISRTAVVELAVQYWQEVGVDVRSRVISGELQGQRTAANLMDATNWIGGRESDVLFPLQANYYLVPANLGWERTHWPLWENWFVTDGREGEEPPEEIKQLNQWWVQVLQEPDPDTRVELGKNILRSQAENLWMIGTVGMIPHPIIVNKNLRNVPETGFWGWDSTYTLNRNPAQVFFAE